MPFIVAFMALLLLAGRAAAAPPTPDHWPPEDTEEWQQAQKYAAEGAEKLMRSFEMMLQAMPYGLPHVDDEGNIVIPRQHPHPLPPQRPDGRT